MIADAVARNKNTRDSTSHIHNAQAFTRNRGDHLSLHYFKHDLVSAAARR